jgi:hypothetical protein
MKLLDEISKMMEEAIAHAKCNGEDQACATYNTKDGYIDVWINDNNECDVVVCHWNRSDTDNTNLETAITEAIPCWESVELDYDDDTPSDWVMYYNRL